jgi:hypothetical protein
MFRRPSDWPTGVDAVEFDRPGMGSPLAASIVALWLHKCEMRERAQCSRMRDFTGNRLYSRRPGVKYRLEQVHDWDSPRLTVETSRGTVDVFIWPT